MAAVIAGAMIWFLRHDKRPSVGTVPVEVPKTLYPFINLNSVSKIAQAGNRLMFTTPNGVKSFDLSTNTWTYAPDPNARFSIESPHSDFYSLKSTGVEPPSWAPSSTYKTTVASFGDQNARWILTALADEGATYFRQDLINVQNRKVYELPFEEFVTFLVEGRSAWVAGPLGISRINLDSGKSVDYQTLPAWQSMMGYAETEKQLFYVSFHLGLFSIDTKNHDISPVSSINVYAEQGYKFFDLLQADGRLFLLARQMDTIGRYLDKNGSTLLLMYNPETGATSAVNTKISLARRLVQVGTDIIGYGSYLEGYEGGESAMFGGAFSLSKKGGEVSVLSELPIASLQFNPWHALSIELNDQRAVIRHLDSPGPGMPLAISRTEYIVDGMNDVSGDGNWMPEDVVFKADRKRFEEVRNILAECDRPLLPTREKGAQELFGKLTVSMKTIQIPGKDVPVRQF